MKIGLIRCEKNETKCPLSSCFKALAAKHQGFAGYDATELAGVFTCRCPGDNVTNLLKVLKSKGAERVHVCTCMFAHKDKDDWVLGQGFCPGIEQIIQRAAREAGIPCVMGSAHLPSGYIPNVIE
jgi:predicted metal-binding protein